MWVAATCVGEGGGDNVSRGWRETKCASVRTVVCDPSSVRPAIVIVGWGHAWWCYSLSWGWAGWSDGSRWCVSSSKAPSGLLSVLPPATPKLLLWVLLHRSAMPELLLLVLLHLLVMLNVWRILWDDVHGLERGWVVGLLDIVGLRAHV